MGFYDTPGSALAVALAGHHAYVADGGGGLRIIDIANPAAPTAVGFYDTPGWAYGVALAGHYAYVADYDGGLRIIDIGNPAAPTEVGFYDTPGWALGVALAGHYAYVADGDGGLVILRLLRDKVTAILPLQGGDLSSTAGDAQFLFPPGSFTSTVSLTYRQLWVDENTSPLTGIGRTFDLSAVYRDTGQVAALAPGHTFTATLHYTDAERGGAIESTLALYSWDGSAWVKEPTSVLDAGTNTITAAPNHLGLFAVLGNTLRLTLPVVVKRN
ncbi:MAG: LVIVD repeat protein [Chloroflexi bacterium ADurb.Bin180]|nr:MAG: LVIVD repeat protein [Chloroflexi bacterium ADurb.Bin180]